jgi:hypothetical protein
MCAINLIVGCLQHVNDCDDMSRVLGDGECLLRRGLLQFAQRDIVL